MITENQMKTTIKEWHNKKNVNQLCFVAHIRELCCNRIVLISFNESIPNINDIIGRICLHCGSFGFLFVKKDSKKWKPNGLVGCDRA